MDDDLTPDEAALFWVAVVVVAVIFGTCAYALILEALRLVF